METVQDYLEQECGNNKSVLAEKLGVHTQNVNRYLDHILVIEKTANKKGVYRLYSDVGRTLPC